MKAANGLLVTLPWKIAFGLVHRKTLALQEAFPQRPALDVDVVLDLVIPCLPFWVATPLRISVPTELIRMMCMSAIIGEATATMKLVVRAVFACAVQLLLARLNGHAIAYDL